MTVSELNRLARGVSNLFHICRLSGEYQIYPRAASGHWYFRQDNTAEVEIRDV
jgi:hypothetical protein